LTLNYVVTVIIYNTNILIAVNCLLSSETCWVFQVTLVHATVPLASRRVQCWGMERVILAVALRVTLLTLSTLVYACWMLKDAKRSFSVTGTVFLGN